MFGSVSKVRLKNGEFAAKKTFKKLDNDSIWLEGKALWYCSPVVPHFYGFMTDNSILMECINGKTLNSIFDSHISTPDWLRICLNLSKALKGIHVCGYLHNDLKNENIMVDRKLDVTIIDMGLARKYSPLDGFCNSPNKTPEKNWHQSPHLAPEALKERAYAKSDIFSFGVILKQIAYTGNIPQINLIAQKCTRHDKDDRPQMEQIVDELLLYQKMYIS